MIFMFTKVSTFFALLLPNQFLPSSHESRGRDAGCQFTWSQLLGTKPYCNGITTWFIDEDKACDPRKTLSSNVYRDWRTWHRIVLNHSHSFIKWDASLVSEWCVERESYTKDFGQYKSNSSGKFWEPVVSKKKFQCCMTQVIVKKPWGPFKLLILIHKCEDYT